VDEDASAALEKVISFCSRDIIMNVRCSFIIRRRATTEEDKSAPKSQRAVLLERRMAISTRMSVVIVIVILVALVAVGEYEIGLGRGTGTSTAKEVDLHIIEDNPVLQEDHFYPDTMYIQYGSNISLAVQNTDDETRVFTLSQFNVNLTIASGTTQRVTIFANKLGNSSFMSPIAPPSPASQGRKAPCLEGFFIVTQNATLVTSTSTGTGTAPSEAQAAAAANGPIGGCSLTPLTVP
jgi:hypothetical protein